MSLTRLAQRAGELLVPRPRFKFSPGCNCCGGSTPVGDLYAFWGGSVTTPSPPQLVVYDSTLGQAVSSVALTSIGNTEYPCGIARDPTTGLLWGYRLQGSTFNLFSCYDDGSSPTLGPTIAWSPPPAASNNGYFPLRIGVFDNSGAYWDNVYRLQPNTALRVYTATIDQSAGSYGSPSLMDTPTYTNNYSAYPLCYDTVRNVAYYWHQKDFGGGSRSIQLRSFTSGGGYSTIVTNPSFLPVSSKAPFVKMCAVYDGQMILAMNSTDYDSGTLTSGPHCYGVYDLDTLTFTEILGGFLTDFVPDVCSGWTYYASAHADGASRASITRRPRRSRRQAEPAFIAAGCSPRLAVRAAEAACG